MYVALCHFEDLYFIRICILSFGGLSMRDDRFTNLERDIIRTVGRVLSSQDLSDLKNTIYGAMDQVEKVTQKTAQKVQNTCDELRRESKSSTQEASTYHNYNTSSRRYSNQPQQSYTRQYPSAYRNLKVKGTTGAGLWLAFSICGIVLGACSALLGSVVSWLVGFGSAAMSLIGGGIVTGASIISTVFAGKSLSKLGRFKKYLKAIGNHPMYTVKEIAAQSGCSEDRVYADLPKFLTSVTFPFAKLDDEKTCLILEKETYQQYLDLKENRRKLEAEEAERKARLAANPNAAAVEEMKKNGLEYLHKIRLVNDALPEQRISEKLDRLENICRKIFDYVEKHPNKLPQIRKLMSYYLPMTLKLVETYEQLEAHRVQSASIEESKEEIHSALDKINMAFENLFDRLLENERMDLSADISVLETMLAQEGLTDHTNNINSK